MTAWSSPTHASDRRPISIAFGLFSGALLMLWLSGGITPLAAYQQTETCDSFGTYECDAGETPTPISWSTDCVGYQLNEDGSRDFASDRRDTLLQSLVEVSFNAWNKPDCSNLKLVYRGRTSESQAAYRVDDGPAENTNTVIWRDDDWPHNPSAFAITSITYNANTGEIADADIELNGDHFSFGNLQARQPAGNRVDVRNVLTHEVGHLIGLGHPNGKPDATMWRKARVGEIKKRSLEPDDIDGLCHIYPDDHQTTTSCTQPADFVPASDPFRQKSKQARSACHVTGPSNPNAAPPWPGSLSLLLLLVGTVSLFRHQGNDE